MTNPSNKILVVDNHPLILRFMADLLEKKGYEVATAEDALRALDILEEFRPDLIFIDLVMPYIGGEQLCRLIRRLPGFERTYIVILSAIAAEEQTDFINFGANACIAKGPLGQMAAHILEVIKRAAQGDRSAEPKIIGLDHVYQRQATLELLSSKRRFESILENITEGILQLTPKGKVVYANPVALALLGFPEERLLASDFWLLFPNSEQPCLRNFLQEKGILTEQTISFVLAGRRLTLRVLPTRDENGLRIGILQDVTDCEQMEQALRESEKKYRLLFTEMVSGFILLETIYDPEGIPCDYRFLEVNAAWERMTGLQAAEVIGRSMTEVLPADGRVLMEMFGKIFDRHARFEHLCSLSSRYLDITAYRSGEGQLAVLINDISERKRLEEKLHEASTTDDLTGLLNRRGFIAMAEKQLKIADREQSRLYLLFADFDNLKAINDHLGHSTGDKAIAETAEMLRETFRKSDILGRLGGDEFAVLLTSHPGTDHGQSALTRLAQNIERRNRSRDRTFNLSLSCGLAEYDPLSPCLLDELLSRADQEMYDEKKGKKAGR